MIVTAKQITDALEGLRDPFVSDRALASQLNARHLRGGKITKQDSKEGAGVNVHCLAFDELGNCVALCLDGKIRQFIS